MNKTDKIRFHVSLEGISNEIVSNALIRNGWRALLYANKDIRDYNSIDYVFSILNAQLLVSLSVLKDAPIVNEELYANKIDIEAQKAYSLDGIIAAVTTAIYYNFIEIDVDVRSIANEDSFFMDINNAKRGVKINSLPLIEEGLDYLKQEFFESLEIISSQFDFYASFIERRLNGEPFSSQDLKLYTAYSSISKEKFDQGQEAVFHFIKDHYEGLLSEKVNIARVIFIGPGGTGKTSLIKALNKKKIVVGKEKPTPGISTSAWSWGGDCNIDIRFWDFAGQVTTHAMHKFFLRERCLYILLLTTRDDQEIENQAEYWLEHIRLYGNDSPVIVVANKIDGDSEIVNFNEQDLLKKYPSIIAFKKISAAKANSLDRVNGTTFSNLFCEFENLLVNSIKDAVSQYKNELSEEENRVKEALFKLKNTNFIDSDEFIKICNRNNITDKRVDYLKDFFNNLGIIVHFPDLNDDALLNPKWLSYGVYEVLRLAERSLKRGWISKTQIREHLKQGVRLDDGSYLKFTIEKINTLIIECIINFKLGYSISRNGVEYIVMPSVLDKNQPNHNINRDESVIHFIYDFEVLLPPYLLHAFVSKSSVEIANDWAWQSGVVISDDSNKIFALIENFNARKIDIYIVLAKYARRKKAPVFLSKILNRFNEIIQHEKGSERPIYRELIEIPQIYFNTDKQDQTKASRIIDYEILQDSFFDNEESCRTKYGKFNVKSFFGDYPMKKENSEYHIENTTNNYITGNQYTTGSSQYVSKNNLKVVSRIEANQKEYVIDKITPILKSFIQAVKINKDTRRDVREIKNFLEELSNYPDEIEHDEIEEVKNKMQNRSFLQKITDISTVSENLFNLGEQLVPWLDKLQNLL